jgi:pilus assembly protein TadC
VPDALGPLVAALHDGLAAGGPLDPLLRALARRVRTERGAAARLRAERLPTRLTFPTALCLLPATVLAIGAPIVGAGLGAVAGT